MENTLAERVIGAWTLVTFEQESKDGVISYPLGKEATGSLFYLPGGHVAVNIMLAGRDIFIDKALLLKEQLKYNELGYLAYSGFYHVDENLKLMTHELVVSFYPEWVGSRQIRKIDLNNNCLQLSSDGPVGPEHSRFRLEWLRA
ncbi:lipocalin-like domain-containing protein [Mucilaginibacter sp.]|uniref:lipocalin-like domain-containing protein n=1 Tax=Mucilaginibacter sp. TaxID=1882438 RepID=UPI0025DD7447|nr:lipocalin-like domain-containing protein [Mucilaginibacter sp.]